MKLLNGTKRAKQFDSLTSANVYNGRVSTISPEQVSTKWTRARTGLSSSSKARALKLAWRYIRQIFQVLGLRF